MEKILFINACMRGRELSRTYRLCRVFWEEYAAIEPGFELEEADLTKEIPPCYDAADIERRERLLGSGKTDDEMFHRARQFAQADKIIIGAPYWDLSFPAVLKSYVEHISVRDITFGYTILGVKGLCRAKKLVYITTAGGYIGEADFGAQYFQGLCAFYGIKHYEAIRAEGLDVEINDPVTIMRAAEREVAAAAKRF